MVVLCSEANGSGLFSTDIRYCWYTKLSVDVYMDIWPARVLSQQRMHSPACSFLPNRRRERRGQGRAQPAKAREEKYPPKEKADLNLTLIILFMEMISSYSCLFMQSNEVMSLLTTCLSAVQVWMTASVFLASAKGEKRLSTSLN